VKVDGEYKVYQLASDVDVELDGDDADLDDLEKGYDVKIEIENNRVTEIRAFSDSDKEVSGVLQSVSQTSITVKVDGEYEVYQLSDDVDVELDGDDADIDDLEKGYEVKLVVEDGEVISIEASSGELVEGVLDSIGDESITVKVDGVYKVFELADDVEVFINDQEKDLDDLEKGMKIELILDLDEETVKTIKADSVTIS
jgi:hypothetical protein